MRARRPGRHSDEVMGPRALAAMADAARRSREAGVGPESDGVHDTPSAPPTATPDDGVPAVVVPGAAAPDTSITRPVASPAPSTPPGPGPDTAPSPPPPPRASDPGPTVPTLSDAAESVTAAAVVSAPSASGAERRPERSGGQREDRRRSSALIVSVSLMVIVAALLGTWVVQGGGGGSLPSSDRHPGAPATTPNAPPVAQAGHSPNGTSSVSPGGTSPTATAPAPTTTTTSVDQATGAGPVLATIEPDSGAPGQHLVLSGSNLLSPSGQITAHFGVETATIACLAPTSCIVMVPPDGAFVPSAPVTVTTDNGTSNPLTFSYT